MTSPATVHQVCFGSAAGSLLICAALTTLAGSVSAAPVAPAPSPPTKARTEAGVRPRVATPATPRKPQPWARGVSAANRAEALRRFKAGNALFARARYTTALVEYRRALKLWDHPSIRYNMAVCFINSSQHLAAWKALKAALRHGQGPLSTKRYNRARTFQKLLQGRLAFVQIASEEPGAEVTLDGELLFSGPGQARRPLTPGYHVVVASKAGFITSKRRLQLKAGTLTEVKLGLVPIREAFKVKRRWKQWIPWTVLGSALAVGAVGLALTLQSRADVARYNRDFATECPDGCVKYDPAPGEDVVPIPDHLVALEKRARRLSYAGITLLTSAGAAAAVGVTLLILNLPERLERKPRIDVQQRRLTLFPQVGPSGAGLTALLRF